MIEDCTPENGPLMVIPGSHRGRVYDHHLNDMLVGGIRERLIADQLNAAVSLTAPAGSISIHHVRTLHASSDNCSERERPLLLYTYSAVDAFPVFYEYELAGYDSRILRGEPTLAPRCEPVPMRLPLPRAPGANSIYDNQAAISAAMLHCLKDDRSVGLPESGFGLRRPPWQSHRRIVREPTPMVSRRRR